MAGFAHLGSDLALPVGLRVAGAYRPGVARRMAAYRFREMHQWSRFACPTIGSRGSPDRRRSHGRIDRSEEHTSELQSLMRISYAAFCLKKKKQTIQTDHNKNTNTRIYT